MEGERDEVFFSIVQFQYQASCLNISKFTQRNSVRCQHCVYCRLGLGHRYFRTMLIVIMGYLNKQDYKKKTLIFKLQVQKLFANCIYVNNKCYILIIYFQERGTGDIKLLRHKHNNTVRVVMRRDKTLKVCANHFITPDIRMNVHCGSDKAFNWSVFADYADETMKQELLAIKFGNPQSKLNLFRLCIFYG